MRFGFDLLLKHSITKKKATEFYFDVKIRDELYYTRGMGLVIYLGINSGFNSDWHSVVKGKVRSRRKTRGSKSPQNQRPNHDQ